MSATTGERCARCGLPLDTKREGRATLHEGAGRVDTAAGPIHFGCYWALQREAMTQAFSRLQRIARAA